MSSVVTPSAPSTLFPYTTLFRKRASKITCRRSDVMSKGKKRSGARPGRFLPLDITSLLLRSEERFSRNAETDLGCRLLLEKNKRPPRAGGVSPAARGSPREQP